MEEEDFLHFPKLSVSVLSHLLCSESVRDAVGRKVKLSLRKRVKLEIKADKTENRVLVSRPCWCQPASSSGQRGLSVFVSRDVLFWFCLNCHISLFLSRSLWFPSMLSVIRSKNMSLAVAAYFPDWLKGMSWKHFLPFTFFHSFTLTSPLSPCFSLYISHLH